MYTYIVYYVVRVGSKLRKFYIRPEGTNNTRHHATLFNIVDANKAIAELAPSLPNATFVTHCIGLNRNLPCDGEVLGYRYDGTGPILPGKR